MSSVKKNLPSMAETVASKIIEFIILNKMMPGDKMPTENEMFKKMDVGRSTLREAFKIMSARNILEVKQGSGAFISSKCGIPDDPLGLIFIYDNDRLALDLLDVRTMIEPQTAMLAALNATVGQRRQLEKQCLIVEKLIKEQAVYGHEDIELHKLIAEASGNAVINNLSYILNTSIKRNIIATSDSLRDNNTLIYHRKTIDAIINGDPISARNSMMIHINLLREYIADKTKTTNTITNK
ncbi:FadR/GntR family transcriptional regulator [Propionispira raffinosivorans]|uniref:FadR/GntR family transcriptional regulator n=1 Tax=Propionispira raffinosivorans TaxID=86959 RepID=UPI00036F2B06|nr:FCD domain-containing protein [Propionispira raffinosivorans]